MRKLVLRKPKAIELFLHLIFPRRCAFCGDIMPYSKTGIYICADCAAELELCSDEKCCSICGTPMGQTDRKLCKSCHEKLKCGIPVHYDRVAAFCVYNDKAKNGIIELKQGGNAGEVRTFAHMVEITVLSEFRNVKFDFVTAVPPRAERMKRFGFDQSHYIASNTARFMGVQYVHNMFKRVRETEKQANLDMYSRSKNIIGAFGLKASKELVRGKTILVIDDVSTTGATLNECARVLKDNGAKAVYGAAIATTAEQGAHKVSKGK